MDVILRLIRPFVFPGSSMTRLAVLAAIAAITSTASAQEGDYTYRVEAKGSYALHYRPPPSDFHFASGYALGGEAEVRFKPNLGVGITLAAIRRDTLTSAVYGAAINIHTAPDVILKLGLAGVRAPYRIVRANETRTLTMPALHLGGEFARAPLRGNPRFILSLAIDDYLMFFTNRELSPPTSPFETFRIESDIVMVPLISAGAGILLGGRKAP
jgi:hypothetical protein